MSGESRTKNSILNFFTGIGGQILVVLLNFVSRTVFIKILGAEYLGISGLFGDILTMLSLAELGFDTAISFKLYKPMAEHDDVKVRQYVVFFRNVYCFVGMFMLAAGLALIPFLRYLIKDYDSLSGLGINAVLIFVLFLLQNVSTYLFMAYRSIVVKTKQKQYLLELVGYAVAVFGCVAKILSLVLFRSFIAYIIAVLITYVIQNLANAAIATKRFPQYFKKEPTRLSRGEKRDLYKDCAALLVDKVNVVVLRATDNIVLSTMIGLAMVGLYSNYLAIHSALYKLLRVLLRAVKASLGDMFASDSMERKYRFFKTVGFLTALMYGTAGVCVAAVGNELIECWIGSAYVLPQPLPLLVGAELVVDGMRLALSQIIDVSGIFKKMWFRPLIGAVINVIASIVLATFWGVNGVVAGTIIATVCSNILIDPILIHKYSFNGYKPVWAYYARNLFYLIVIALVCAGDLYVCSVFFTGRGIWSALVHTAICGISVPAVLLLVFRGSEEFKTLYTTLRNYRFASRSGVPGSENRKVK